MKGLSSMPYCHISIHAPAWGATENGENRPVRKLFQSTRPRGARRILVCPIDTLLVISIHAPAWGATMRRKTLSAPSRNFNPRARVGRDSLLYMPFLRCDDFNPRARVGRDKP